MTQGHILAEGTQRDPRNLPLFTRKRTPIPNRQDMLPYPPEILRSFREILAGFMRSYPRVVERSLASVLYNCVGLVFASRRTWINPDQADLILRDDEYRRVGDDEKVLPGDIVIYRKSGMIMHVGVVMSTGESGITIGRTGLSAPANRIVIMSKWGRHGEYLHSPEEVLEQLGAPSGYYTDRSAA